MRGKHFSLGHCMQDGICDQEKIFHVSLLCKWCNLDIMTVCEVKMAKYSVITWHHSCKITHYKRPNLTTLISPTQKLIFTRNPLSPN